MNIFLFVFFIVPITRSLPVMYMRRQQDCGSKLGTVAKGLLKYESAHGELPPAFTVDENGNRLHSWRTLILPYVGKQALYDSIDLTQPWDAPVNTAAAATEVATYLCPASKHKRTHTTYMAIVGPSNAFTGSKGRSLADFTDGASDTIMLVDADDGHAVHWMSPIDTDGAFFQTIQTVKMHHKTMLTAFADGTVHRYSKEALGDEEIESLLTVGNGEQPYDARN
jgi:hypothetical protein